MRMNYKMYPTDYVQELNSKGIGGRKKAMAFMSYWNDMQHGDKNAFSFYGKSWGVSKSTAHTWIKEFVNEISLFNAHWELRNLAHYSSVSNQAERQPNGQSNDRTADKLRNCGNIETVAERSIERLSNEAFNIYDDDGGAIEREFNNLFFIYSQNGGFTGNRTEALEAYRKIRMEVELEDLISAINFYLHDNSVDKKYNIKNFLRNKVYLNYVDLKIRLFSNGTWLVGRYNKRDELFYNDDTKGILKHDVFANKLIKKEIVILGREVA